MLAARDRDAGELIQFGVAVNVVGNHRLFEPAQFKLLQLGQHALGVLQVPAHVALEHQIVVVADHFTNRFDCLQVFRHALGAVGRAIAEARLEHGETLVQVFLRFVLHRLDVGAVELGVVAGDFSLVRPPSSLNTGLFTDLPRMSQIARSIAEIAAMVTPLRPQACVLRYMRCHRYS